MSELLTHIPDVCFPHELDRIVVTSDADVQIELKSAADTLRFTLSPDSGGQAVLTDFAPVLRDLCDESPEMQMDISFAGDPYRFRLHQSKSHIVETLAGFGTRHFLSLLMGETKRTHLEATELLHLYNPAGDQVCAELLWTDTDSGAIFTSTEENLTQTQSGTYLRTSDVSPRLFTPPAEDLVLHSYTITAGQRIQHYLLHHSQDIARPVSFRFLNNFNLEETIHLFGTTRTELKPERSLASFNGQDRNHHISLRPTYKTHTGSLLDAECRLLTDLLQSTRVWHPQGNDAEIIITDEDCQLSDELYSSPSGTISWRYATHTAYTQVPPTPHTFDHTFDHTYHL